MNKEQIKAIRSVERALNKAGRLGLSAGIYDRSFIFFLASEDREEVIEDAATDRADNLDERYTYIYVPDIDLDGGAGV